MEIVALIISLVALGVTIGKAIYDFIMRKDAKLLLHLGTSLENAYKALVIQQDGEECPVQDRHQWLTTARYLLRYTKMKNGIRTKMHRDICLDKEEYWRHRFYLLLEKIPGPHFYYWESREYAPPFENISPLSLAVIIAFTKWTPNNEDPLHSFPIEKLIDKYDLLGGVSTNFYFAEYVKEKFPEQFGREDT